MAIGVENGVFARHAPRAHRRNDIEVGSEGARRHFEPDLVVALARATVSNGISAFFECNFNLAFREKWPRDRCTEQILAFIHRTRFHERPKVFGYEFVPEILNVALGGASSDGFLFEPVQLVVLADIAGHGNDFTAIVFLEPRNDYGSVETAGVRQHDLLHFILHNCSPSFPWRWAYRRMSCPKV